MRLTHDLISNAGLVSWRTWLWHAAWSLSTNNRFRTTLSCFATSNTPWPCTADVALTWHRRYVTILKCSLSFQ